MAAMDAVGVVAAVVQHWASSEGVVRDVEVGVALRLASGGGSGSGSGLGTGELRVRVRCRDPAWCETREATRGLLRALPWAEAGAVVAHRVLRERGASVGVPVAAVRVRCGSRVRRATALAERVGSGKSVAFVLEEDHDDADADAEDADDEPAGAEFEAVLQHCDRAAMERVHAFLELCALRLPAGTAIRADFRVDEDGGGGGGEGRDESWGGVAEAPGTEEELASDIVAAIVPGATVSAVAVARSGEQPGSDHVLTVMVAADGPQWEDNVVRLFVVPFVHSMPLSGAAALVPILGPLQESIQSQLWERLCLCAPESERLELVQRDPLVLGARLERREAVEGAPEVGSSTLIMLVDVSSVHATSLIVSATTASSLGALAQTLARSEHKGLADLMAEQILAVLTSCGTLDQPLELGHFDGEGNPATLLPRAPDFLFNLATHLDKGMRR